MDRYVFGIDDRSFKRLTFNFLNNKKKINWLKETQKRFIEHTNCIKYLKMYILLFH